MKDVRYRMEVLRPDDPNQDRSGFFCGEDALDRYLKTLASQDMRRGFSNVVVAMRPDSPVIQGYYTLSAASVDLANLPEALRRKMPRYGQVPAVLLGRLAVSRDAQGQGLGARLLADAMMRAVRSDLVWAVFIVKAKNERAAAFYRHFDFCPFGHEPLLLWLTRRQVQVLGD